MRISIRHFSSQGEHMIDFDPGVLVDRRQSLDETGILVIAQSTPDKRLEVKGTPRELVRFAGAILREVAPP